MPVGLALSPALSSALGSAKVTLLISVHQGEKFEALQRRDAPGDGAPDDSAPDDRGPDLLPWQTEIAAIGALAPSELDEIDRALNAGGLGDFHCKQTGGPSLTSSGIDRQRCLLDVVDSSRCAGSGPAIDAAAR
jgi:hypothetical protein